MALLLTKDRIEADNKIAEDAMRRLAKAMTQSASEKQGVGEYDYKTYSTEEEAMDAIRGRLSYRSGRAASGR